MEEHPKKVKTEKVITPPTPYGERAWSRTDAEFAADDLLARAKRLRIALSGGVPVDDPAARTSVGLLASRVVAWRWGSWDGFKRFVVTEAQQGRTLAPDWEIIRACRRYARQARAVDRDVRRIRQTGRDPAPTGETRV